MTRHRQSGPAGTIIECDPFLLPVTVKALNSNALRRGAPLHRLEHRPDGKRREDNDAGPSGDYEPTLDGNAGMLNELKGEEAAGAYITVPPLI